MTTRWIRRPAPQLLAATGAVALLTAALAAPGTALAHPRSDAAFGAKADSTGPIVVDSSGHGYLAWTKTGGSSGDPVMYCKVAKGKSCKSPITMPLGAGAKWDNYDIVQPYPVVSSNPKYVQVVAPSYVYDDIVVWGSHDHGKSFSDPKVIPDGSYANNTGVDDVLLAPFSQNPSQIYFSIASHNVGLGYSFSGVGTIGAMDPPSGFQFNTDSIPGGVDDATLGYDGQQTIEAFSTDATKSRIAYFWSPVPGVSGSPGTLEHGPTAVTDGMNPRLVGGPKGLFLLSEDLGSKASKPLDLDVRKWDSKTKAFGSKTVVGKVPNDINATNPGGFGEDAKSGDLIVAWPGYGKHHSYVMHEWISKNGGKSFGSETTVSKIGEEYSGPTRIAATGGKGFLTFEDSKGLELVDLTHL